MAKRRITHDPHQFVNTAADRRRLTISRSTRLAHKRARLSTQFCAV
jgi:hypothetical protein